MGSTHKCYCYKTATSYIYTLRQGTRLTNSIVDGRYKSRQGRNAAVRKLIQMYSERGIRINVIRGQRPPKK